MKKLKLKSRNPFALHGQQRKAGTIVSRKFKRVKDKERRELEKGMEDRNER